MRLLLLLFFAFPFSVAAQNNSIELNSHWQFRKEADSKWYKATVPGTIHTDLFNNKLIPDPFYSNNEYKLQWIDSVNWEYQTVFNVEEKLFAKQNIDLDFDGLDTYADVYLNGKLILQANNMFRGWTIPVKPFLKRTNNILRVKFFSAQNKVDSIAKSRLPLVLPDNNRVYARKAQFQFGWDWGPKFVGCGIWKKVKLEGWNKLKIEHYQNKLLRIENDTAFIETRIKLKGNVYDKMHLAFSSFKMKNYYSTGTFLHLDSSKLEHHVVSYIPLSQYTVTEGSEVIVNWEIATPHLWNNNDADNNYNCSITIYEKDKAIDEIDFDYSPTNTKLIQQPDSIGTSFYFEKDGQPVYMKGANWIPGDIFLPRLKKEDYRRMLQSAKDANMNMLRVWGGGVYEADEFYELCDSMGIMVWQDLMFAGGMYPGDDAFMKNVKEEIRYQVQRLRNHNCIVLWCGNNEIDEAWHNWGWQEQFNLHGADSAKIWNDYERLFEDSLQTWINEFDGTRPYVSTSPKNGWGHKESFTEGDSHYWGIWWGLEDWEAFKNKTGRFVSEYGMQAMPNMNTIKSYADSFDRYLYSPAIKAHQKANDGFNKLNYYLNRYFIDSNKLKKLSLEEYTYLTQCLQYYILKNSIALHRNKYPANMGTLLWQLNDCWPVTSWSITDYSRQPKAAWYAVKQAYDDTYFEMRMQDSSFMVALHSPELANGKDVKYSVYDSKGKIIQAFSDSLDTEWKETGFQPWIMGNKINYDTAAFKKELNINFADVIINAALIDREKKLTLADNTYYPYYPKDMPLSKSNISLTLKQNTLTISADSIARFVYLEMPGITFSDNYFDLLPGQTKTITVNNYVDVKKIKLTTLYDVLNK